MDFSTQISIISIIVGIASVILSITNYVLAKRSMKIKIKMTNEDVRFNKIETEYLYESTNLSLTEICEQIINYFKIISTNNIYELILNKKYEDKFIIIKIVNSLSNDNDTEIYDIDENAVFSTTFKNKKPYYINNITYFRKRDKNLSLHHNKYQSIIMCPIRDKNSILIGGLTICIMNPLNDLINKDNITEFLDKICEMIASNKEFIEYSI